MGLDNGIILRRLITDKSIKEQIENKTLEKVYVTPSDFCVEKTDDSLCYWRKCWNIRKAFLNVLDKPDNLGGLRGYYLIEPEEIPAIMRNIIKLCNKDEWEDDNPIWEFEEMQESLIIDLVNLKLLQKYLNENKDVIALFYDSY